MHIKINHLNVLLGEREVITGLNLDIPSGTSVAIVGKSGVVRHPDRRCAYLLAGPMDQPVEIQTAYRIKLRKGLVH